MTDHTFDSDDRIDRIASDIGNQKLDDATARQITDRVWDRLCRIGRENQPLDQLRGFPDRNPGVRGGRTFRSAISSGGRPHPQCVPCRRVAHGGQERRRHPGVSARPARENTALERRSSHRSRGRPLARWLATVRTVDNVYDRPRPPRRRRNRGRCNSTGRRRIDRRSRARRCDPIPAGAFEPPRNPAHLPPGRRIVVEMDERSELVLRASRRGTTIDLERGNIIVHAADQRGGRLFVATNDCEVAVKGTIFAVNHGLKGSRVSVIEGEVEVREGSASAILLPGDQIATGDRLRPVPLEEEIAWSQDAARIRHSCVSSPSCGVHRQRD